MGKDSIKFAKTFQVSLTHTDTCTVGSVEDYYPMGTILEKFGYSVQDFETVDKAMAAVRHLCEKNREEHGYGVKAEILDEKFPQFSRFWFVESKGKQESHTQHTVKKLEQEGEIKNLAQLQQAKMFMEGRGCAEGSGESSVKIENLKHVEIMKCVELMKSS